MIGVNKGYGVDHAGIKVVDLFQPHIFRAYDIRGVLGVDLDD